MGGEIRVARVTLSMSGRSAARRAGVSSSTEQRIELGDPNVSVATLCAVAEAVGLDLVLHAYPGRAPGLRDTGQLDLVEVVRGQAHEGWQPSVELLVGQHGESIDLALFGPREIWACEIERMATDFQAQYRRADRKRAMLAALHQRAIRLVLVVEDTRRNRASIREHEGLVRAQLPAGSREIIAALRTGSQLGRDGLLWLRRPPRGR
jgi:transcriptional regulator with XRE-family HTH domain